MTVRGAVAAGDPQTAEAGAAMLRAGGTPVDAVVAAAFAAFVAEAPLCSPAGAGVLLFGGGERPVRVLDFFAAAPGRGLPEIRREALDFHPVTIGFGPTNQVFQVGRGAAAVPTALFGLVEAHRIAGRLPLRDVLAPAISLARDGAVLSGQVASIFALLRPILTLGEGVAAIHSEGGVFATAGSRLTNRPLADFLAALADEGEALLRGPFTDAVLAQFGPEQGGLLTRADLEEWRPTLKEPLRVGFGGRTVLTNPPPSTGGALVALGLRLADRLGVGRHPFLGRDHLVGIAAVLDAMQRARVESGLDLHVREPDFVERLLADPARWAPLGSTTHISVIAREGAASLTFTNGEGCGHVVEPFGVHMNNLLGEEDINPLGFHAMPPGTPMTTMMAPTIVLDGDRPVLALGSGGSNRIRSVVLQALVNVLAFGRPLTEAIAAPRMHPEGSRLSFEAFGLDFGTTAALQEAWGDHASFEEPSMFFGGVHAVGDGPGGLIAAGDARRGGAVALAVD